MKYFFKTTVLLLILTVISCTKNKVDIDPILEANDSISQVNDFIWRGLNTFYLWQDKVENLSDTRFSSSKKKEYIDFLNSETNPEAFFKSLLYKRVGFSRVDQVDKWSWIVEDYIKLEKAFQGVTKNNGMEFGLVAVADKENKKDTIVFGYVRYVLPKTDAADKKVKRGMIFNRINGVKLNLRNYRNLLFSTDSYTIDLANFNEGNPISNGKHIELLKSEYPENPVFIDTIISINGSKKIGYLMYNSFTSNFDGELNSAFSKLKADGVTDLIIDLRYNGGGSVRTAIYLSSMITGQFNGELLAKEKWNSKLQASIKPSNLINNFTDRINNRETKEAINSLNLTKVYFITTRSSASASELVINSLKPYIDVKTIGTKTHGKYVGSITLYDSPKFSRTGANTNHNWAMQPIVFEIVNKLGENNKGGLTPDIELDEDYANLGVLGEVSDPLLKATIKYITTGAKGIYLKKGFEFNEISNSKLELPTSNNMYIELPEHND